MVCAAISKCILTAYIAASCQLSTYMMCRRYCRPTHFSSTLSYASSALSCYSICKPSQSFSHSHRLKLNTESIYINNFSFISSQRWIWGQRNVLGDGQGEITLRLRSNILRTQLSPVHTRWKKMKLEIGKQVSSNEFKHKLNKWWIFKSKGSCEHVSYCRNFPQFLYLKPECLKPTARPRSRPWPVLQDKHSPRCQHPCRIEACQV